MSMHAFSVHGPELRGVTVGQRVRCIAHLACVDAEATGTVSSADTGRYGEVRVEWDCGKTCCVWMWELRDVRTQ